MPLLERRALASQRGDAPGGGAAQGYGTDPDLTKIYHPGDVWPLTLYAARSDAPRPRFAT